MKIAPLNSFTKASAFLVLLVTMAGLGWIAASFSAETENVDLSYQRYFNDSYKIFSLNMPSEMTFAGEEVPLEIEDVRESLDRELLVNTYWQSQSLLFHKRANRWFPVIEPILAEQGVPDDFKYLAVIESGLENVVSPAGATGYWQLLRDTGREYGLEINNEVDERYSVEKSTVAACKYLKTAYERYGSWTMAAASYNMGMYGLAKQVDRQKADNYYDLLLNTETGRYLYRTIAVKELLSKPAQYGFHFRPKDLYQPYETYEVTVDSAVSDFTDFAFENGINYKILKILNPWLRDTYITNPNKKEYKIKLPKSTETGLVPFELRPEQKALIDTSSSDSIK